MCQNKLKWGLGWFLQQNVMWCAALQCDAMVSNSLSMPIQIHHKKIITNFLLIWKLMSWTKCYCKVYDLVVFFGLLYCNQNEFRSGSFHTTLIHHFHLSMVFSWYWVIAGRVHHWNVNGIVPSCLVYIFSLFSFGVHINSFVYKIVVGGGDSNGMLWNILSQVRQKLNCDLCCFFIVEVRSV